MALITSNLIILLYTSLIQHLLFQASFSKSTIKPTNFSEKILAVMLLWIIHRLIDVSISASIDATVYGPWKCVKGAR
jgi:hypothetical protein